MIAYNVAGMEGGCHFLSGETDSAGASTEGSGASLQALESERGGESIEQVTTGDNSTTLSDTNGQERSVRCAWAAPQIRRVTPTKPGAQQSCISVSDPLCSRCGGVRFGTVASLQCPPYTGRISDVVCEDLATLHPDNLLLHNARIAWSSLPVAGEPTLHRRREHPCSKAESRRDCKIVLAQLRRGPRRSRSEGFTRTTTSVAIPCRTNTSAVCCTKEEDSWSYTRRNVRGRPVAARMQPECLADCELCTSFVVRRRVCTQKKPGERRSFSSGSGRLHICTCCNAEELSPTGGRELEDPPPREVQAGSVPSEQVPRGRGSLEAIPVGCVAALKTELERWIHDEKQRRGRNRVLVKTVHLTAAPEDKEEVASGQTHTEGQYSSGDFHSNGLPKAVIRQSCRQTDRASSRHAQQPVRLKEPHALTGESLYGRRDTLTSMSGVGCREAKCLLGKQSRRAAESAHRPLLRRCSPLFASVACVSSTAAVNKSSLLYKSSKSACVFGFCSISCFMTLRACVNTRHLNVDLCMLNALVLLRVFISSETTRFGTCGYLESGCPANQRSARSDGEIYGSRLCKSDVSTRESTQTATDPEFKAMRQKSRCHACSSTKSNADRSGKRLRGSLFTQKQNISSYARASRGPDTEIELEPRLTLDLGNDQGRIRQGIEVSFWTTWAQTQQKKKASQAKPLTQQSLSTDRLVECKTVSVEERRGTDINLAVPEVVETARCDSRDMAPRHCAEMCFADNSSTCPSPANTPARRPPHIPRLELAKVHEARDALYRPLHLNSSSKDRRFSADSRLTSSTIPHSIFTQHDRQVIAARMTNAYFTRDEELSVVGRPAVKLVEEPLTQGSIRQQQRVCVSRGCWLPTRTRVVRCSPNLFTARVCTILRKQLHAAEAHAGGTRQPSPRQLQPSNEESTTADEREGSCSPAEIGMEKKNERNEPFCAHRTVRRMFTHGEPATVSKSEQHFAGCCNTSVLLTSCWSSSTRPPSLTSSVSCCSDPSNTAAKNEEEQLGPAAPHKGEPATCAPSTNVCDVKTFCRPSRTLRGPRLCWGIHTQQKLCHSKGRVSYHNLSVPLDAQYVLSSVTPEEGTTGHVGESALTAGKSASTDLVPAASRGSRVSHTDRLKCYATEHSLSEACERGGDRVSEESLCHVFVDTLGTPLSRDHQGRKAATRGHDEPPPSVKSLAETSCKRGPATGSATFLRGRRLALLRHSRSETGYYSDVPGKFPSAQKLSAQVQQERTQASLAHYIGTSFF